MDIEVIKKIYNNILEMGYLNNKFAVVFVYNSYDCKDIDDMHRAECITSHELGMICNAFQSITDNFFEFDGEDKFLTNIKNIKDNFQHVLVYSMAQNINGIGRRSLVPLICDYNGFYNMGADFFSSTLGCNKNLMHMILEHNGLNILPETCCISTREEFLCLYDTIRCNDVIVKPNSESASIGVERLSLKSENKEQCLHKVMDLLGRYKSLIFQEFIKGQEVEVSLLKYNNQFFAVNPIQIVFMDGAEYLDKESIATENYDFDIYSLEISQDIIEVSKKCAEILEFRGITRFDFRIQNGRYYLIDISPNPTISEFSSTNYAFSKILNDKNSVYKLLAFGTVLENGLLVPSFHSA